MLVVVTVIVILMALLLPSIGAARSRARQTQCSSNQRQIWQAWTLANSRSPAQPVRGSQWLQRINPYIPGGAGVAFCPDDFNPTQPSSFGFNANAWQFSAAPDADRIALLDYRLPEVKVVGQTLAQLNDLFTGWPGGQAPRHFQQSNVTLGDGRNVSYEPRAVDPRYCVYYVQYWRPDKDQNINLAGCFALGQIPPEQNPAAATGSTTSVGPTTGSGTTGSGSTSGAGTTSGGITTGGGTTGAGTTSGGATTGGSTTGAGTTTGGSTTGSSACSTCGAFVGTNGVSLNGVAYTDSYNSNIGPYSAATATQSGNVCSNGPITLIGGASIHGAAHPGPGYTVSGASAVTGSTTPLAGAMSLPPVDFQNYATVNNNASIPLTSKGHNPVSGGAFSLSGNESLTLPGGTYYFTSISMSGNSTLTTSGPVVIYCTGSISAAGGSVSNSTQKPADLKIYCTGSTVSLNGSASFQGVVYAPNAAITRTGGSADCYGALIGNTLTISGSASVHFDLALAGLINVGCP